MTKFRLLLASGLVLSFAVAQAQTANTSTASKPPLTQAQTSVGGNLEKNPDNKGLKNAAERLKENQERLETRKSATADRIESAKAVRAEKPMRPEKAERPQKPERVERVERPGR